MVAVVPNSLFSIFSIRLMHAARIISLIYGIPILVRYEIRISRSSGSVLQAGGCIIKLHVCFFVGEVDRHPYYLPESRVSGGPQGLRPQCILL